MAGPDVSIRSIVEKEITVTEHGQKVTKLVPVSFGAIASSLKLYFTLTITNEGDDVATNVVIDNPIPPDTIYTMGSATGTEGVVVCSVDNGESFHRENEQLSNPGRCTDIRWVIDEMPPGSSCKLGFQVFVGSMATPFWAISSRQMLSLVSRYRGRVRSDIVGDRNVSKNYRKISNFLLIPQLKLTYNYIGVGVAIIITTGATVFYKMTVIHDIMNTSVVTDFAAQSKISEQMFFIAQTSLVGFVAFAMASFIFALMISHRIAGPVVAITDFINELKKGNYSYSRRLRPNDELTLIMDYLHELKTVLVDKQVTQ